MDEHDKRAREVVESVRGMSPEAQALVLGNALRAASRHGYERGELAALATSNEEQAEAVAAERERCAKLVEQYGGESDFCPNGCSMGYLADVLRSEADALEGT